MSDVRHTRINIVNADLLRQRRNLMLVSGVLILFDFADVSITKVSVLGTQLLVGNPTVLIFFSWIIWAYFFLRYYQFLREEGDLKIISSFSKHFYMLSSLSTKVKIHGNVLGEVTGRLKLKNVGKFSWEISLEDYDPDSGHMKEQYSRPIQLRTLLWLIIQSSFHVAAHTSKITDHIVPFVLAILAPIITLVG